MRGSGSQVVVQQAVQQPLVSHNVACEIRHVPRPRGSREHPPPSFSSSGVGDLLEEELCSSC